MRRMTTPKAKPELDAAWKKQFGKNPRPQDASVFLTDSADRFAEMYADDELAEGQTQSPKQMLQAVLPGSALDKLLGGVKGYSPNLDYETKFFKAIKFLKTDAAELQKRTKQEALQDFGTSLDLCANALMDLEAKKKERADEIEAEERSRRIEKRTAHTESQSAKFASVQAKSKEKNEAARQESSRLPDLVASTVLNAPVAINATQRAVCIPFVNGAPDYANMGMSGMKDFEKRTDGHWYFQDQTNALLDTLGNKLEDTPDIQKNSDGTRRSNMVCSEVEAAINLSLAGINWNACRYLSMKDHGSGPVYLQLCNNCLNIFSEP